MMNLVTTPKVSALCKFEQDRIPIKGVGAAHVKYEFAFQIVSMEILPGEKKCPLSKTPTLPNAM